MLQLPSPDLGPLSWLLLQPAQPKQSVNCLFGAYPSPKRFTFRVSASHNSRVRKKVKSNAELCTEVREFLASVGLPEDHVHFTKELLHHGRSELAYIVRRRGHKLLRELLSNSRKSDINDLNAEKSLGLTQEATPVFEDSLTGLDEKINRTAEVSLGGRDPNIDLHLNSSDHVVMSIESTFSSLEEDNGNEKVNNRIRGDAKIGPTFNSNGIPVASSAILSFEEKVEEFTQNGELDLVEDNVHAILDESGVHESKGLMERAETIGVKPRIMAEQHPEYVLSGGKLAITLNGSISTSNLNHPHVTTNHHLRDDQNPSRRLVGADSVMHREETISNEEQAEINRLKLMLHHKGSELTLLNEQIEKEKLALSNLQTKVESEINKAQEVMHEKEVELHAVEESLSGLEEVEIQYSGDGEIVEVTGSFNGWHHKIKLDPLATFDRNDPSGSRKSKLWSTLLWLYPGTYEIKFIVDGQWKIDPQRDSVTKGTICNNILQVEN